jgi:hypothetical protein
MVAKLLETELFECMKNIALTGNKLQKRTKITSFARRARKRVTFDFEFRQKTDVI